MALLVVLCVFVGERGALKMEQAIVNLEHVDGPDKDRLSFSSQQAANLALPTGGFL
ncbi:MAG: hypothetical protein MJA29_08725 [Candidatus Omnitrophica bacterium]|nr:hypothetical protein [Candidatus Omnitrophota bacterium]